MNERIREFADQALIHANKTWDPSSDASEFVKIAMEKHAELIITAVIDTLSYYDYLNRRLNGFEYNYANPIIAIKEQFGVEE